eukprot:TRINITY_DN219_c1_g1_i3.p1 TRINITY_DN219_c1_g1~~TRINITY_DN219_c1_g1_i3.p1  ORF type:complete len:344 (-),score=80.33 TRINITY_DN219_c1_g1_i3:180-1211(-)
MEGAMRLESEEELRGVVARQVEACNTIVYCAAFAPQCACALGGCSTGRIAAWRLDDGAPQQQWSWKAHNGAVYGLAFADDSTLVTVGEDGALKVWDWPRCELVRSVVPAAGVQHPEINDVVADPQSHAVVYAACGDGRVAAYDPRCQGQARVVGDSGAAAYCVRLRRNGRQLLSGGEDGLVRLWDTRAAGGSAAAELLSPGHRQAFATAVPPLVPHQRWISSIALDPTDNWMACGGGDCKVTFWHLPSLLATTSCPTTGAPQAMCWLDTPDAPLIVGCNESSLYHMKLNGTVSLTVPTNNQSVFAIASDPAAKYVVSAGSNVVDVFVQHEHAGLSLHVAPAAS